jgi:hypothetical protein
MNAELLLSVGYSDMTSCAAPIIKTELQVFLAFGVAGSLD